MSDLALHALAPPWHLPGTRDDALLGYLRDEAWDDAVTLLRDVVTADTHNATWLVLLAYARFRDACEVMVEQRLPASQEALGLLHRAMALGAPLDDVAPLLHEVEAVLDEETRAEVAALATLPSDQAVPEGSSDDALTEAAFRLWATYPARAALAFEALAQRLATADASNARLMRLRAGVAWADAGQTQRARPALDDALTIAWHEAPFREERALGETALTHLLQQLEGADFTATWQLAVAIGQRTGLPFPSVRPNQERLLNRCVALRAWATARSVGARIEETREQLPAALAASLAQLRLERA